MGARGTRLAFGAGGLVLLWIAVYWWWGEGGGSHLVSFDSRPPRPVAHLQPDSDEHSPRTDPAPGQTRRTPEVVPPRYRTYIPLEGETWESIAQEQLGDAALAAALRRANPLRSGGPLQGGREIRIPLDPDNIQGRPTPAPPMREQPRAPAPTQHAAQTPAQTPAQAKPEPLQIREYTVQDQDTLGDISKQFYGSARHWEFIYEHNRTRLNLQSETSIRAGQILRIPPLPEGLRG